MELLRSPNDMTEVTFYEQKQDVLLNVQNLFQAPRFTACSL